MNRDHHITNQAIAHRVAIGVALLLAALTVLVYAPAFRADFVDFDDPLYVTENEWVMGGLNRDGFIKAWTERVAGNWHPITMLSHLLDVTLFGMNASGHHATSIAIHALNTMLLFVLLRRLFGGVFAPALAAALFAVHPFNVDSVVWISERKNVLSTFFWLAATERYVRFSSRPTIGAMSATILFFLLGLMSKPMLVTLPITLLMLDLWPLRKVNGFGQNEWPKWKALLQEKYALFMLALVFSMFTIVTQFPEGYEHSPVTQPLWGRILFAMEHYRMYLQKFFWPVDMSVFYPRLEMPPDINSAARSAFLLIVITFVSLKLIRRAPAWAFGWFWFAGTIFPVVGIIGIGQHSIADRYMYVPMMGLLIGLVWGLVAINRPPLLRALAVAGVIAVLGCAWLTRGMLPHWQNSETLYRQSISVTEGNFVMLSNLGRQMMIQNRTDEAIVLFEEALRINPRHVKTLNNLGFALATKGDHVAAAPYYERALENDPRYEIARLNLARSLLQRGRYRDALMQYDILVKFNPASTEARDGQQRARDGMHR